MLFPNNVDAYNEYSLPQCTKKTFRVTSYYSPLVWQEFYFRPSYQDEIVLNWRWTHGASWKAVFNWMIAAPKSYWFGTKIFFPWRWVGQVEDRWWAIVNAWERDQIYDRIDIRAWKWEDWLRRALSFWVQYLEWYVCDADDLDQNVGFDFERFPQYDDFFERMIWIMNLQPWRDDPFVQALQRYLVKLGYMDSGNATWTYWRITKAAICVYQQRYLNLPANHESCWTFGPLTRSSMNQLITKSNISLQPFGVAKALPQDQFIDVEQLANLSPQQQFHHHLFTDGEFSEFAFDTPILKWTNSKEVRILQRKLAWLWYYKEEEITWIYDNATIKAVFEFQKSKWVITWNEDPKIFWYLWPATRWVLNKL